MRDWVTDFGMAALVGLMEADAGRRRASRRGPEGGAPQGAALEPLGLQGHPVPLRRAAGHPASAEGTDGGQEARGAAAPRSPVAGRRPEWPSGWSSSFSWASRRVATSRAWGRSPRAFACAAPRRATSARCSSRRPSGACESPSTWWRCCSTGSTSVGTRSWSALGSRGKGPSTCWGCGRARRRTRRCARSCFRSSSAVGSRTGSACTS
jgi:hypothetical protein